MSNTNTPREIYVRAIFLQGESGFGEWDTIKEEDSDVKYHHESTLQALREENEKSKRIVKKLLKERKELLEVNQSIQDKVKRLKDVIGEFLPNKEQLHTGDFSDEEGLAQSLHDILTQTPTNETL